MVKCRPWISDYAMDSSWASNASLTVANGEFALCGSAIVWALADIVADVAEVGRDAGLADAGLEGGFDGACDVSPKLVSYTASLLNKNVISRRNFSAMSVST